MGFFPRKGELNLTQLPSETPIVFFESAKRLKETIKQLKKIPTLTTIILAKELTKKYERFIYATPETIDDKLENIPSMRGEWIGLFMFSKPETYDYDRLLSFFKKEGFSTKDIGKIGRFLGLSKNELYKRSLDD